MDFEQHYQRRKGPASAQRMKMFALNVSDLLQPVITAGIYRGGILPNSKHYHFRLQHVILSDTLIDLKNPLIGIKCNLNVACGYLGIFNVEHARKNHGYVEFSETWFPVCIQNGETKAIISFWDAIKDTPLVIPKRLTNFPGPPPAAGPCSPSGGSFITCRAPSVLSHDFDTCHSEESFEVLSRISAGTPPPPVPGEETEIRPWALQPDQSRSDDSPPPVQVRSEDVKCRIHLQLLFKK